MRVFSSKVRAVLLSHPVVSKGLFTLIKISLGYNNCILKTSNTQKILLQSRLLVPQFPCSHCIRRNHNVVFNLALELYLL